MTAKRALATVLLWGLAFSLTGGAVGAGIGTFAPDYYRSMFRTGHSLDFKPLEVGIGLGVTQGLASGVAISLGVVALLTWQELRSGTVGPSKHPMDVRPNARPWVRYLLGSLVTSLAVVIFSTFAFVLGGIIGQEQLYQAWTDHKLEKLAIILQADDFSSVSADYSSAAQVYLIGSVRGKEVRTLLREKLVLAFGTEEADEMIRLVEVTP